MRLLEPVKIRLRLWKARRKGDPELRQLGDLIPAGSVAFDIGANRGVYSLALSAHASRVIAFEPFPGVADRLEACRIPGLRVHRVALSDASGETWLRVPAHRRGGLDHPGAHLSDDADGDPATWSQGLSVRVPLARLDDFATESVAFIKIDVEGHEERVLSGGWQTLSRARPRLLVELEEKRTPGVLTRVPDMLAALGYRCFFLDAGHWHSLDQLQPGQIAPSGRYINNFLFTTDRD